MYFGSAYDHVDGSMFLGEQRAEPSHVWPTTQSSFPSTSLTLCMFGSKPRDNYDHSLPPADMMECGKALLSGRMNKLVGIIVAEKGSFGGKTGGSRGH